MSSRSSTRRPACNSSQPRRKRVASATSKSPGLAALARRFEIEVVNQQKCLTVAASRIRRIARQTLDAERVGRATISIALVDNRTIHRLNRRHLNHDYETDVLSFLFETEADHPVGLGTRSKRRKNDRYVDGEIVISVEMAAQSAVRFGWSASQELELYLVHGLLHLCGYDDGTDLERRLMRRRERSILKLAGD
jgi:probable rRNA maturation factor